MLESTKLYISILLLIGGCVILLIQDVPPYSTIGKTLVIIGVIISLYVILPLIIPLRERGTTK